jgi:hypothetical protein
MQYLSNHRNVIVIKMLYELKEYYFLVYDIM